MSEVSIFSDNEGEKKGHFKERTCTKAQILEFILYFGKYHQVYIPGMWYERKL